VRFPGFRQADDFLPAAKRDPLQFAGSVAAWGRARAMAGIELSDLDLIELHDCFTIAELVMYGVLGIAPRGTGRRALDERLVYRDGRLPVNLSGGLKSKGCPVGATGVSQHVLAAMQLSGTTGALQLEGARRAAVDNMGGLAVANYVSVLEAW
jgi:acetyl-CoA C-acetyltransferase